MKILFIVLLISFIAPLTVGAVNITIENPLKADSLEDFIYDIVNFLFKISLPVGALMITISAFYFLGSGGDPEKVKTAKNIIIWTIVGILVLFLSVAIMAAVKKLLGI